MAVTIISRPEGHKLGTVDISASIINDGLGDALVYTGSALGLSDGNYVFIESNLDSYNGFKYVDSVSYDAFKIKNSQGGEYVEFKQNAEITFRISVLDHAYNCVHIPIVYELRSDLWPINVSEEEYTPVTIDSVENYNGYTKINLNRGIEDLQALNYIKLIGDGVLEGAYQIVLVVQPWSIVINLAYDAANVFTPYSVQNYYNNYFITVNVYGGLDALQPWYTQKPYELLASLKFIPDSEGDIKFSISDILKGQIITRNNLTLDTLPLNLDFFTKYYIGYYESYDLSDGSNISIFSSEEISDIGNLDSVATNSILEFKSLNSGAMSDYIFESGYPARWLNTQDRPIAFVDRFFDLSFIKNVEGAFSLMINGAPTLFEDFGIGIYRIPIPINESGEKCCYIMLESQSGFTPDTLDPLSAWYNINSGPGQAWTTGGASPYLPYNSSPHGLNETSDFLAADYIFDPTHEYTFSFEVDNPIMQTVNSIVTIALLDSSNNILTQDNYAMTSPSLSDMYTVIPPVGAVKIAIRLFRASATNITFEVTSFIDLTQTIPATNPEAITETICIDAVEECSGTFVEDDLRLTEGGLFRELE